MVSRWIGCMVGVVALRARVARVNCKNAGKYSPPVSEAYYIFCCLLLGVNIYALPCRSLRVGWRECAVECVCERSKKKSATKQEKQQN